MNKFALEIPSLTDDWDKQDGEFDETWYLHMLNFGFRVDEIMDDVWEQRTCKVKSVSSLRLKNKRR